MFHLVEPRELKALPGLTTRIRKEYVGQLTAGSPVPSLTVRRRCAGTKS